MTETTKFYMVNMFFNYTSSRAQAEAQRERALTFLTKLLENKSQFACIAKDEINSCLMLKVYAHLKSPCTQVHLKRMVGKYSTCKPSYFGDMVSLCRFVHIDRHLTTVGKLPRRNGRSSDAETDPSYIVKILVDSIDRHNVFKEKGNLKN
jgi:hypothetical protein